MRIEKEAVIRKIRFYLEKENRTKLLVIIGLVGILLIFLSTFFENDSKYEQASEASASVYDDTEKYKAQLEAEIKEMVSNISGVGDVMVMITFNGTTEIVYAEELLKDTNSDSVSFKNQYVLVENDGDKEALVKKINKPQVCGVAVVCEGGDDVRVAERVVKAVSAVLDVSSANICVVPLR